MKPYTICWINGSFTSLHYGHFKLFEFAASIADAVFVGVDTDDRIISKKGEDALAHKLEERVAMLRAIRHISRVFSFSTDEELRMHIENLKPSIMVLGSDWAGKDIVGGDLVENVVFYQRTSHSSTKLRS